MKSGDLQDRTKEFARLVIRRVEELSRSETSTVIGRQLLRAGTSVGANYRAACRARSRIDFIAKMKIVEEECDEAIYWMELLLDAFPSRRRLIEPMLKEANELLSIVVSSIKTARSRL